MLIFYDCVYNGHCFDSTEHVPSIFFITEWHKQTPTIDNENLLTHRTINSMKVTSPMESLLASGKQTTAI